MRLVQGVAAASRSDHAVACSLTGPCGAGTNMLAGTISWLGGCALWATSVEYVRRRFFELFYKTHILGLVTFFLFGFMHHVSLWAYTMPGAPHTPFRLSVQLMMASTLQPSSMNRQKCSPPPCHLGFGLADALHFW